MKQNLTKENFWNHIEQKYPLAFKLFSDFIDNYKKENNWWPIFNQKFRVIETATAIHELPKYHDLPLAMQTGIYLEWISGWWNKNDHTYVLSSDMFSDWRRIIEYDMAFVEKMELRNSPAPKNWAGSGYYNKQGFIQFCTGQEAIDNSYIQCQFADEYIRVFGK